MGIYGSLICRLCKSNADALAESEAAMSRPDVPDKIREILAKDQSDRETRKKLRQQNAKPFVSPLGPDIATLVAQFAFNKATASALKYGDDDMFRLVGNLENFKEVSVKRPYVTRDDF